MDILRLHQIEKAFSGRSILRGLSLGVSRGEIAVIIGRSGCGKTTLLRVASGLETPESGTVQLSQGAAVSMVFQEPRLMPWLNVEENICLPLRGKNAAVPSDLVETLLRELELTSFRFHRPDQLSGGTCQRVALARALIGRPDILLLDEPFAALDAFTREAMQQVLLELRGRRCCTMLFVTHSLDEALTLGDRILLMGQGRILQMFSLSHLPASRCGFSPEFVEQKRRIMFYLEESCKNE